ncbi:hypothetical protein ACFL1P_00450 [Patescibacteria group bacterium]
MVSLPDLILPKKKYFGLSIDRTSIRGIEVDDKRHIKSNAEILFTEELFTGNLLLKPDVFTKSLIQLKEVGKFSSNFSIVCFPEAFAYTRALTLPSINPHELHEAVMWRIKELFPFPESDIYIDWRIVDKKEQEFSLSVVAVQKKILDPILSSIHSAGIKPLRFEPGGLAIARLLVIPSDKHTLVLEINKNVAYVTLVEGRSALFTTLVNYRSNDTIATFIARINQTLKEISLFYIQKGVLKEGEIEITLTGEVVTPDWVPHIIYPAKILETPINNPAYNKSFAVSIARVVPPSDPDTINLLPAAMQQYYDNERNTQFYQNILIRVLIVVVLFSVLSLALFTSIRLEQQKLEQQVIQLTGLAQDQPSSLKRLLLLNAQAVDIVSLAPLRITPAEKIQMISTLLPEGIVISQWLYDDSKLQYTFVGIADTRDTLLQFKDALETSEEFENVVLPLGTLEMPIDVQFEITFISSS